MCHFAKKKKPNEHKRRQKEEKTDKISTEKIENINKTAIASVASQQLL